MSQASQHPGPRETSGAGLIVLTGPSGVGKTTVAQALRRLLGEGWVLWLSDLCQPQFLTGSEPEDDRRAFEANVASISAYVTHGWPVIAELSVLTAAEVSAISGSVPGPTVIFQLRCSADTLASHLDQRVDSRVPRRWAERFYDVWLDVELVAAVQVSVDDLTPVEVATILRRTWLQRTLS